MPVKAVLFDLGGTLVRTADIPEIYRRILDAIGVKVSPDEVLKAHRANGKEFDPVEGMVEMGRDFWIKWNLKVLERVGIKENREFLARKIDELWWEHANLEVYQDVRATLAQLKAKGIKTGVVTNGLQADYQQILSKLGLTDSFDTVVGIDTCNTAKPDEKIFLYALDKLHVRPEEAIFVGNSVEYDYEGAKEAGLKPLIINRDERTPMNADTIRSLTEVLSLL